MLGLGEARQAVHRSGLALRGAARKNEGAPFAGTTM
jgi:hypothetical protein